MASVSPDTVRHWLRALPEGHPFLGQYARAREDGADAQLDDVIEIADRTDFHTTKEAGGKPLGTDAARVMIEARLKYAAMTQPRKYGAKVDVTSGGKDLPAGGGTVIILPDNGRDISEGK